MVPMTSTGTRRVTPGGNHPQQSDSSARPLPLFTVVMLEKAILQHIVMIPTKAAMTFGEHLSEIATLTVPDGRSWRVRLKKKGERIWLCDGLQDFVNYYSIQYGFILQFIYQGSSEFSVRICNVMGSEIDYPFHNPTKNDGEPNLDSGKGTSEHDPKNSNGKPNLDSGKGTSDHDTKNSSGKATLDHDPKNSNGEPNLDSGKGTLDHDPKHSDGEPNLDSDKGTSDDDRSIEILDSDPPFSHGSFDKHKKHTRDEESIEILDVEPPTSHAWSKSKASNVGLVDEQKYFEKSSYVFSPGKRGRPRKKGKSVAFMGSADKHEEHTRDDDNVENSDIKPPTPHGMTGHVNQRSFGKSKTIVPPRKRGMPRKQETSAAPMDSPISVSGKRGRPKESNKKSCSSEDDTEILVPRNLTFTKSNKLVMSKKITDAHHAAIRSNLKNESTFLAVLQRSNMNEGGMHVPAEFVRKHNLNQHSGCIQLQAHNEKRKWPAKLILTPDRMKINKGWGQFSASKNLKEGDVCLFELINNKEKEILMRVWIYRSNDYMEEEGQNALKKSDLFV